MDQIKCCWESNKWRTCRSERSLSKWKEKLVLRVSGLFSGVFQISCNSQTQTPGIRWSCKEGRPLSCLLYPVFKVSGDCLLSTAWWLALQLSSHLRFQNQSSETTVQQRRSRYTVQGLRSVLLFKIMYLAWVRSHQMVIYCMREKNKYNSILGLRSVRDIHKVLAE